MTARIASLPLHSCISAFFVARLPPASRVAIAETIDRVLAVVAGDLIALSDVNAAGLGLVTPSGAADPIRACCRS